MSLLRCLKLLAPQLALVATAILVCGALPADAGSPYRYNTSAAPLETGSLPAVNLPPGTAESGTELDSSSQGQTVRRSLVVASEHDAVRVPSHADLAPRSSLTIELWVKHRLEAGCGTLVGKGRTDGYWLGICDGRLRFISGQGAAADGTAQIPADRWAHVALTYDGSTRRFYVNGQLDRQTSESATPLGRSETDLTIGADTEPGFAMHGLIDNVRLWSVVRSEEELGAGLYHVLGSTPGLVAEWQLDGSARDMVGGHDGRIASGGSYLFDGVLPRDLTIPLTELPIELDGHCRVGEYSSAGRVVPDGPDGATVYLIGDRADVYLCFDAVPRPRSQNATVAVYADWDWSRDDLAQPGDYRLRVNMRGTLETDEGDGNGVYRDLTLPAGSWDARQVLDGDFWSVEFRLPRRLIERPSDPDDPMRFGLAVSQPDEQTLLEMLWPIGSAADSPASWSTATLAQEAGLPPRVSIAGSVVAHRGDGETAGLADAVVQLYARDEETVTLIDTVSTDSGGRFEFTYEGAPPEALLVREVDPRGAVSLSAEGGVDGNAVAPNLIEYVIGRDMPRTLSEGQFVDSTALPDPQRLRQHYLIVYSEPVTEQDLWPIVQAKAQQGFLVVAKDARELERSGEGRDLAERIHTWLREYWESVEPDPVYALLVGRGDRIPVRDIGWMDNDHRDPARADYYPAWPTDWYYADLDSEWDADGDGFYGEFMRCRPGDTYPDPDEGELECPEDGSLAREGPFGALRTKEDDFIAEISIGRIAANEPGEVRRALSAAVAAERSGSDDKRRALLGGSLWWFEGRSWDTSSSKYVNGGSAGANPWVRRPWSGERPFGRDTADFLETVLDPALDPAIDSVVRLYESTTPVPGLDFLSPTAQQPDAAITPSEMASRWRDGRFGLINLAGPGWPQGIRGARWQHDWDGNLQINHPSNPTWCTGKQITPLEQVGPPCWELIAEDFVAAGMPSPSGIPPVVIANAGSTGTVGWTWDGMDEGGNVIGLTYGPPAIAGAVPATGAAAAWVGSMVDTPPGTLDDLQLGVNAELLHTPLRLGDALWSANSALARAEAFDMRSYGVQLYGDPAFSYWGNWADTSAAWPQEGRDWRSTNSTAYSGPSVPALAWTTPELGPSSPPVVGRHGEIVAAGASGLVEYSTSGDVVDRADLAGASGQLRMSPVLVTDGAYVAGGTTLYSLDTDLSVRYQMRMPSGARVSAAPRVGPDGVVWVPTDRGMVRVTGDRSAEIVGRGQPSGPIAFLPAGEAIWSTQDGLVVSWHMSQFGEIAEDDLTPRSLGRITGPAVSAEGTVFVGSRSGRLHAFPAESPEWQVNTGAAVTLRPTVSQDGTAYVANEQGVVAAYGPESSTEIWRRELDVEVEAPMVADSGQLYVAAGRELYALDQSSGATMWHLELGGALDERSTPVVGPDRTIYLLRADGRLLAIRESGWLPAPTHVTLTKASDRVTVRWRDNSAEEVGFGVELCAPDGECTAVGSASADATAFTVSRPPFAPGEPLFARVQARGRADPIIASDSAQAPDTNHSSEYSRSQMSSVSPGTPEEPDTPGARVQSAESIEVTWSYPADPGQLLGFRIERRTGNRGSFVQVGLVGADARRFVDRDLLPDTEYTYQIAAVNEGVDSESGPVRVTATTKPIRLRAPSELLARSEVDRITLQWRDNANDETGYIVERRSPGSAIHKVVARLGPNARRFVDSAYVAPGFYHYRVRAVGEDADSAYVQAGLPVGGVRAAHVYIPWAWR